jgi:hypothetical protein
MTEKYKFILLVFGLVIIDSVIIYFSPISSIVFLLIVVAILLYNMFKDIPVGHEDEDGFHYGEKK